MSKPVLTLFYQFNPWHSSIGGIQSVIKYFIKYTPDKFRVRLVGTGKPGSEIGKWQQANYEGRDIDFMPLIAIEDDDVRSIIPTSVKYTAALVGRDLSSDFMHFHRIEPTLATFNWSGEKTLFVHNDIQQQIKDSQDKNAILWKYFPAGYFAMENLAVKQFDRIYVCNTESLKLYQKRYSAMAKQIEYIRNAVDFDIFYPLTAETKEKQRPEFAREKGLADDTRFILFAGRLHPQKDPLLLIRSLAALSDKRAHLLIAGDGDLKQEVLQEIASLGLSNRVTMLGSVARAELAKLYRLSSIFVLTSAYEGLPIVVLEALASGTPIVTTKAGETPNFLTSDSGIVTPDRTPQAIADALQNILTQPQNFPSSSCVGVTKPYAAQTIVEDVCETMWQRWERREQSKQSNLTAASHS